MYNLFLDYLKSFFLSQDIQILSRRINFDAEEFKFRTNTVYITFLQEGH